MVDIRTLLFPEASEEIVLTLDELARKGARRTMAAAVRAVADEPARGEPDEDGHRLLVRNGRARERTVTVGSGTVLVRAPRVNDMRLDEKTGERRGSRSSSTPIALTYHRPRLLVI